MKLKSRYVGEYGFKIRILTGIDLTLMDVFKLEVTKPALAGGVETITWTGAVIGVPTDGTFEATIPNVLDIAGTYTILAVVGKTAQSEIIGGPITLEVIARPS